LKAKKEKASNMQQAQAAKKGQMLYWLKAVKSAVGKR